MANALPHLDVILTEMERGKAAPCTQGHLCSFPERRNQMKVESPSFICTRLMVMQQQMVLLFT